MSVQWIDKPLLGASTSRVVRRADYEQLIAAHDVLASARESAAGLETQLEALRQDAVRAGHAAGVELGKNAWAQQLAERHLAGQAQLRDLQPALLDVVMGAVRHLVQELPAERRFELLAQQVISSTIRARQLRLVVAAADAPAAQSVLAAWRRTHADVVSIDVVVDDGLHSGDCVLETDEGAIDGRLEQRLADIEAALTRHLAAMSPAAQPSSEAVAA